VTDLAWELRWYRRVCRVLWLLTIATAVGLAAALVVIGIWRPEITERLQHGSGEALLRRVVSQIGQINDEETIRLLTSALEAGFREEDAAATCGNMLGDRLVRQGRYAEALEAYAHVPVGWRSHASQFSGYARALLETGHLEVLEPVATRWLELAELENNLTQQIAAHTTLGTLFTRLDRQDAAEIHFAKAAELRGNPAAK
jgi:hypothetical protein